MNSDSLDDVISRMSREACVTILESYGFACYDHESVGELREALAQNIKDGTIPAETVDSHV